MVHPLSRALVGLLIPTGISPNAVSISGVFAAAAAAAGYVGLPWPAGAFVGFGFHIVWHVLDGADGDLARRTGRTSSNGELIDGVCDYAGRAILYVSLAWLLSGQIGWTAWPLAVAAGLSRLVQANSYETLRRNYRRWVYGVRWIRQDLDQAGGRRGLLGSLGGLFLWVSARVTPDDRALDAALALTLERRPAQAPAARALLRERLQPAVKRAGVLATNHETVAVFASLLAGSPLFLFLYILLGLNAAYAASYLDQKARIARLQAELAG